MNEIRLTGLKAGHPLGFLAALGVFRHATTLSGGAAVTLHWTPSAGHWCPVLRRQEPWNADQLVQLLVDQLPTLADRPEWAWSDQIKKTTVADYWAVCQQHRDSHADWFVAFASELGLAKDGTLRSTLLDMTGGQQKFLLKLRQASASLAQSPSRAEALFREALFGPWRYEAASRGEEAENSHSLGLDPSTLLKGAFTAEVPAGIKDKRGIRGAIWLAFEALPLLPCVYENGPRTVGFVREQRTTYFYWSIWDTPLSLVTVRTVLQQAPAEKHKGRGIVAQFRSERINLEKDYYALAPAELVVE